jgi:hypothetical protein
MIVEFLDENGGGPGARLRKAKGGAKESEVTITKEKLASATPPNIEMRTSSALT